jgi:hypothetical protein
MEILQHAGVFAKLTLVIVLLPLVMASIFVVRPTERHLALMRPFSLAGLFAALSGGVLGFLHVLRGIGITQDFSHESYSRIAVGAAESLVPMFFGFSCLSVAWLLVGVGMSRNRAEV